MDEYNSVIAKYDRLCVERNNNLFWADNITEATEGVTSAIVWQNFYAYLGNDSHVFTNVWKTSLGELVDDGLTHPKGDQMFKTKTVQNGNVTHIKMTPIGPDNLRVLNKNNDGKQMAFIPEGIQEEKSWAQPQTGNETG